MLSKSRQRYRWRLFGVRKRRVLRENRLFDAF
jgi:hypothetical protein